MPSFADWAESLALRPGLFQTILMTFFAVLITWAVTSFQQHKRLTWRDYLDTPVNLDPQQASQASSWKSRDAESGPGGRLTRRCWVARS